MLILTDEEWNVLFDAVDMTVTQAIDDLPDPVKSKASGIMCVVEKYYIDDNDKIIRLGCYIRGTNGPIIIYAGRIYEECGLDMEKTLQSVRQVYYHELAHAIGDLREHEVKERGL